MDPHPDDQTTLVLGAADVGVMADVASADSDCGTFDQFCLGGGLNPCLDIINQLGNLLQKTLKTPSSCERISYPPKNNLLYF